jgi:hypothetical protein
MIETHQVEIDRTRRVLAAGAQRHLDYCVNFAFSTSKKEDFQWLISKSNGQRDPYLPLDVSTGAHGTLKRLVFSNK